MAKPTLYSPEMHKKIVELHCEHSMKASCEMAGVSVWTVQDWRKKWPDFDKDCRLAREMLAEKHHAEMERICEKVESGQLDSHQGRCILSSLEYRAAKMAPKEYGNKVDVTSGGEKISTTITIRYENETAPNSSGDDAD